MTSVIKKIHPLLAEEICKVHEKMNKKLGDTTQVQASKVIAEHLRSFGFVDNVDFVNIRKPKQKRSEMLFDMRIYK